MFAFKLTLAELNGTQLNPNPIPWVIIYYIGKWIMTRKPNKANVAAQPDESAENPLPETEK